MNMVNFDKQFKNLLIKEKIVSHYFQPQISLSNLPRHNYYDDLKTEFVTDIKTFGFSPYLTQTVDYQKKNKDMQKFNIKKHFANGYLNYVKESAHTTSKQEKIDKLLNTEPSEVKNE